MIAKAWAVIGWLMLPEPVQSLPQASGKGRVAWPGAAAFAVALAETSGPFCPQPDSTAAPATAAKDHACKQQHKAGLEFGVKKP